MSIHALFIGGRFTGVDVRPDATYADMWRVHHLGRMSDMVNLSRAKDAAIAWARPRGLGGNEKVTWHRREIAPDAPPVSEKELAHV
jgi:hypothetical protein